LEFFKGPDYRPGVRQWWWNAIVRAYEKKGLTEADAIREARMARILRASDFDFKTMRPIPWMPPTKE
jgi:DNA polymerase-1